MKSLAILRSIALVAALGAPTLAYADGGTISGTVTAKPAKFLPDTVVYLKKVPGKPTHHTVSIDQSNMEFSPHIALLTVGDSVKFQNHDKVQHNVTSPEGKYDLGTWGEGKTKTHKFTKAGVYSQVCKIHPEMLGYVFVGQNAYSAVIDASGNYSITGVPPGTYEVDIWNAKLKSAGQKVTVTADTTTTADFSLKR